MPQTTDQEDRIYSILESGQVVQEKHKVIRGLPCYFTQEQTVLNSQDFNSGNFNDGFYFYYSGPDNDTIQIALRLKNKLIGKPIRWDRLFHSHKCLALYDQLLNRHIQNTQGIQTSSQTNFLNTLETYKNTETSQGNVIIINTQRSTIHVNLFLAFDFNALAFDNFTLAKFISLRSGLYQSKKLTTKLLAPALGKIAEADTLLIFLRDIEYVFTCATGDPLGYTFDESKKCYPMEVIKFVFCQGAEFASLPESTDDAEDEPHFLRRLSILSYLKTKNKLTFYHVQRKFSQNCYRTALEMIHLAIRQKPLIPDGQMATILHAAREVIVYETVFNLPTLLSNITEISPKKEKASAIKLAHYIMQPVETVKEINRLYTPFDKKEKLRDLILNQSTETLSGQLDLIDPLYIYIALVGNQNIFELLENLRADANAVGSEQFRERVISSPLNTERATQSFDVMYNAWYIHILANSLDFILSFNLLRHEHSHQPLIMIDKYLKALNSIAAFCYCLFALKYIAPRYEAKGSTPLLFEVLTNVLLQSNEKLTAWLRYETTLQTETSFLDALQKFTVLDDEDQDDHMSIYDTNFFDLNNSKKLTDLNKEYTEFMQEQQNVSEAPYCYKRKFSAL